MDTNTPDLSYLYEKLNKHQEDQKKGWGSFIYAQQEHGFYQGFDRIGIKGARPTEARFKSYDVEKYLTKDKVALDIGCNCGFFSIHVAGFVKHIDGVEINPYLVNIGSDTAEFLNVDNAEFHAYSFEEFKTDTKYDVIFSLANDSTIDGNTKFGFNEYLGKIRELLKTTGILIFESQAMDAVKPSLFDPKFKIIKQYFDVLENRMVHSNYPYNVPERIFLVLQLKDPNKRTVQQPDLWRKIHTQLKTKKRQQTDGQG